MAGAGLDTQPLAATAAGPVPARAPVIETKGLTKRYGDTLALADLDLSIGAGEVYGFLGPNGAGKTTTIRLLLGLHRASAGTVRLFGADAWRDASAVHRRVAFVSGDPALWPDLTADETFTFLERIRRGVDRAYQRELIERFQLDTSRPVRALSKGNRQKVQLVAALATRAELLVLDEPTTGLDPLMEIAFRDSVREAKERGQTAFLSSHVLSEVEAVCDRVGILRAGRLVDDGTLAALRHLDAQAVSVVFGGPPPELPAVPGVRTLAVTGSTLRLEVLGAMGPLLRALAPHDVVSLTSREPSLEEIFLHHYEHSSDGSR